MICGGSAICAAARRYRFTRPRRAWGGFPYAIAERALTKGYAAFKLQAMPECLELPQGTIRSTLLPHGGLNTLGLVFTERSSRRRFVYYTDNKRLPRDAIALAQGVDAVVLDGLPAASCNAHEHSRGGGRGRRPG